MFRAYITPFSFLETIIKIDNPHYRPQKNTTNQPSKFYIKRYIMDNIKHY